MASVVTTVLFQEKTVKMATRQYSQRRQIYSLFLHITQSVNIGLAAEVQQRSLNGQRSNKQD